MINGEPEDELRRLVIAFYPADGEMAVFEVPMVQTQAHQTYGYHVFMYAYTLTSLDLVLSR